MGREIVSVDIVGLLAGVGGEHGVVADLERKPIIVGRISRWWAGSPNLDLTPLSLRNDRITLSCAAGVSAPWALRMSASVLVKAAWSFSLGLLAEAMVMVPFDAR